MKQLQSKLWAKITALLLLTIFAIVLFFSGLGVLYLADQGGYSNPEGFAKDHIAGNAFYSAMNTAADYYSAILQQSSGGSGSALSYTSSSSRAKTATSSSPCRMIPAKPSLKAPIRTKRISIRAVRSSTCRITGATL